MTIAYNSALEQYVGDGSQVSFDYDFKIILDADLVVQTLDLSGTESTLTLTTDYTVYGAGEDSGGYILLETALTESYTIVLKRVRELTQEADLKNATEFQPQAHEDAFDKLVMIAQQQKEEIGRCIKVSPFESTSFNATLPAGADTHTDSLIVVSSDGISLAWGPSGADIGGAVAGAAEATSAAIAAVSAAEDAESYALLASGYADSASNWAVLCVSYANEIGLNVTAVQTATYNISSVAEMVLCNPSAASFAVTLPDADLCTGVRHIVKNVTTSLNVITIEGSGTQSVDGAANTTIAYPYGSVMLVCDGTEWWSV